MFYENFLKTPPRRRRIRYLPPKSNVRLYEWNAHSKIDSHNEEAIERIQHAPGRRIADEQVTWRVKPRIDSYNTVPIDQHRSGRKPLVR